MPCKLAIGDKPALPGIAVDLSRGGALFNCSPLPNGAVGQTCRIDLPEIGSIDGQVLVKSDRGLHIMFGDVPPAIEATLRTRLADELKKDQRYIDLASAAAAQISGAFNQALENGRISRSQ